MGVSIKNYSLLCNQGTSKFNEDVVGVTPFGAWVLDGATGLNKKNLVSNSSDARWYTQWWNKYLHENISKNETLKSIILRGVKQIKKEYLSNLRCEKIEKLDFPSSSIVVVKFYENKIEYLLLGDCGLFIKNCDKKIIKDRSVCDLDDMVFEKMNDLPNLRYMSFEEIKESVMDVIIDNRLKKNIDGGYWILEFDESAIENSLNGYIEITEDTKLMLTSDGFTCSCDRYNIVEEDNLIDICEKFGIEYVYSKLREFEENDSNGIEVPRFKVKDDASCAYLDIYID
ncbi:hypothetical protein [Asaccharospora irregularis]|uniref:Protein phosphatase 2C n=1 Tax=Asaccharospora irregularis DSM 2635 TaxID=1121321 RepID=A0A1M5TTK6_9FIRM|nr:hypothetical protein [Asaccharospora irregularis]SHH53970.1 hypothetical protein SAMN04488530_1761 [Asaccharospora irregularis DSM 2635]